MQIAQRLLAGPAAARVPPCIGVLASSAPRLCAGLCRARLPSRGADGGLELQQPSRRHQHSHRLAATPAAAAAAAADVAASAAAVAATDESKAASSSGRPPSASIVATLRERGLIQEVTSEELEKVAAATSLSVYCGFDPTADSLHLGNLLGIIVLSWFQRCGHAPVALLGGATGRVGDPSGRSSERPVLTEAEIEGNVAAIGKLLSGLLTRTAAPSSPPVRVLNNLDWFGSMSFLGFLRDIGKFARVGTMLAKDSVRTRLESEQGISFTEFTYQLLQGYDFVHLCREHGVRVQVGGSDQWGNITAGTDLIRRLLGGEEAPDCYGLTFPLLVDANGQKFGKSTGGAIWLSADKLSPYKFYQYLFAVTDADVIKFLKMLTFLPLEEIADIEAAMSAPDYKPNTAQRKLAEEVTRFVHGEEGLQQALKATEALKPGAATQLDAATLEAIAGDAPSCSLPADKVTSVGLVEVMLAAGMLPSKAEVRRMIKGGGVYLNNTRVTDAAKVVAAEDLIEGRLLLLAAGKKNKMLVRVQQ